MNLVSINDVSKTLNDSPLFEQVSFGIDEGEHIGFVGPNGCGKSTFLSLVRGSLTPDTGTVARNRDLTVSVLEQRPRFEKGMTARSFLWAGEDPLLALAGDYERCLAEVDAGKAGVKEKLAQLTHLMEEKGGFDAEHRYESLLTELGITDPDAPLETFSGGMLKKVAMARLFTAGSSLLLLDEPTNHLDIETIEWLEKRLSSTPSAFILVTHDRFFLDAVCTMMLDIDRHMIRKYEGNYSAYLRRKAERAEEEERHEARREAILSVELEWLKRGPKARALKDSHRKERALEMLAERAEEGAAMEGFETASRRLGGRILEVKHLSKAWDGKTVIRDFSRVFSRGERVGIIGPNGSGKSTFLDLLYGRVEADSGAIERGVNTAFGYFDQTAERIDKNQTVLDFIRAKAQRITLRDGAQITAEQFLERFLFPHSMFPLTLSRLSGGELRRLQLIRVLAAAPNFLLLDEPTNDFDIETISLLEDFLDGYAGCLLVISHDRAFLNRVTDFLFVFDGEGGVTPFTGNYSDYHETMLQRALAAQETAAGEARGGRKAPGGGANTAAAGKTANVGIVNGGTVNGGGTKAAKPKKLSFKEQKEFEALLPQISQLEEEKAALEASFASYSAGGEEAHKRYEEVCALIERQTQRWEELAEGADL